MGARGDGVDVVTFSALGSVPRLRHGVSTRRGGVSPRPYASLNVSFSVGDDPDRVRENRSRLARAIGVDPTRVVCARLVHGNRVTVVGASEAGRGFADPSTVIADSDGLVTATAGVTLWMTFADCVPVLLCDPLRRVVGLAHAGWRGTLLRVSAETVRTMHEVFGSEPSDLTAVVGPSIGPCCYEVGDDVQNAFVTSWDRDGTLFRPGSRGRPHLDLHEANRRTLVETGVPASHIEVVGTCTACHVADFFSHRGEAGKTGRFAAVIGFEDPSTRVP